MRYIAVNSDTRSSTDPTVFDCSGAPSNRARDNCIRWKLREGLPGCLLMANPLD
jgi:hypothetical protein